MAQEQVFEQDVDGVRHRVVATGSFRHGVTWTADDEPVAEKTELEDTLRLDGGEHGRLVVTWSRLGAPRVATLHGPGDELKSLTGLGGVDLAPEPGSPAAAHEQKVLDHPTRYAIWQTLGGAGGVLAGIVVTYLLARVAVQIPWPDWNLPSLPFPDVPDLPLPDVPWPSWSLPDWSLPGWLREVLSYTTYVWPVVLAAVLANAEVRRRRAQTAARRRESDDDGPGSQT